jgi:hypothetical protein
VFFLSFLQAGSTVQPLPLSSCGFCLCSFSSTQEKTSAFSSPCFIPTIFRLNLYRKKILRLNVNGFLFDHCSIGMGNILNPEHRHPKRRRRQERTVGDRSLPCRVLALRAMSYHAVCKAIHHKGISDGRFQLLSTLISVALSAHIRRRPDCEKGLQDDRFKLCGILVSGAISDSVYHKLIHQKGISNDLFENLPEVCCYLFVFPPPCDCRLLI